MKKLIEVICQVIYLPIALINRAYDLGSKPWHRRRFAACGDGLTFEPRTSFLSYESIRVGRNVFIGRWVYISGQVTIGDDVMLAAGTHITDGYHRYDIPGKTIRDSGPGEKVPVTIESDAWLGSGCTIMRGVSVGEGSIVGAKAVVLADVPPYSIVVGSPARVVSLRFSDEELREHLSLRGRSREEADTLVASRSAGLKAAGFSPA